jgi:hypothetical protein
MNAQESQIGDGEIVRKMQVQVMVARHRRRYELAVACKRKKTDQFAPLFSFIFKNSLRRSECLMGLHRHRLPFPRRRPLPLGQWRAANRFAMESQIVGYVSVNASGSASASGYHARVHSNINIIVNVNVSPWLQPEALLRTLGICRRLAPMPQPR